MPTQFKIVITKEIIEHCKNCGNKNEVHKIENKCAVAFALIDIFPNVYVTGDHIFPFGNDFEKEKDIKIPLPVIAQQFIKLFDGFCLTPKLRLLLPEFEFTIDVPDEVIDRINIDEVRELIESGKTKISPRNHLLIHS
ncbi:MAG: hypothetical protein ABI863_10410 [Ginsengibacter sp.]